MRKLVLSLAVLPLTAIYAAAADDPTRVENGLLAGTSGLSADVKVFKAIPYAAPPLGDLRWRPPKPPQSWEGVRPASQFSKACMQIPYPVGSPYRATPEPQSEDCLYPTSGPRPNP